MTMSEEKSAIKEENPNNKSGCGTLVNFLLIIPLLIWFLNSFENPISRVFGGGLNAVVYNLKAKRMESECMDKASEYLNLPKDTLYNHGISRIVFDWPELIISADPVEEMYQTPHANCSAQGSFFNPEISILMGWRGD